MAVADVIRYGSCSKNASQFNPTKLDTDNWADSMVALGIVYQRTANDLNLDSMAVFLFPFDVCPFTSSSLFVRTDLVLKASYITGFFIWP